MKKFIAKITVMSMLSNYAFALDFYIVRRGDTLSQIVSRSFPGSQLYGRDGKLAEVLSQNPQIRNPNIIYPNQKIQFHPRIPTEKSTSVAVNEGVELKPEVIPDKKTEPEHPPKEKDRRISETPVMEEWNISALYGAKYLSVSQTGALGKAEVGVLFLNNLKLNSEFIFDNWSVGFLFDSYKFKYETMTSGDSKQIYALNLYGSYKWVLWGVNIEQNPLFRNNSGNVEMTKMTLMYISLGAKKSIELPARKPTALNLKGWVNYPFSSSNDNANIKLDSIKGFGLNGQAELSRQIFVRQDYSLHATWMTQVGLQKLSQNVEWDTSKGEVKSDILDASTALGLLFKF